MSNTAEKEDGREHEQHGQRSHAVTILGFAAFAMLALAACEAPVSELSEVYYRGPGTRVLCAVGIDEGRSSDEGIDAGLDRARDDGIVVQLYAHIPGRTIELDRLTHVLDGARDRGLAYFTYDDFADGAPAAAGLALSFDDASIDEWASVADLLDSYGARVTFFVAYYDGFDERQRGLLRDLAARGHSVGNHTVRHMRAPEFAERHGVSAYLDTEVHPTSDALRADGHTVRTYAYPFGARTSELDRALLDEFDIIRSVSFSRDGLLVVDPCAE